MPSRETKSIGISHSTHICCNNCQKAVSRTESAKNTAERNCLGIFLLLLINYVFFSSGPEEVAVPFFVKIRLLF